MTFEGQARGRLGHRFFHANLGGTTLGLQELDCDWDIEDADATAAAIPARYQITYRTLVHDLTAQG